MTCTSFIGRPTLICIASYLFLLWPFHFFPNPFTISLGIYTKWDESERPVAVVVVCMGCRVALNLEACLGAARRLLNLLEVLCNPAYMDDAMGSGHEAKGMTVQG